MEKKQGSAFLPITHESQESGARLLKLSVSLKGFHFFCLRKNQPRARRCCMCVRSDMAWANCETPTALKICTGDSPNSRTRQVRVSAALSCATRLNWLPVFCFGLFFCSFFFFCASVEEFPEFGETSPAGRRQIKPKSRRGGFAALPGIHQRTSLWRGSWRGRAGIGSGNGVSTHGGGYQELLRHVL